MPFVKISPPAGPLNVFYSISTPTNYNADAIIPGIPTILFLHPEYISQQIFEAQFSDYALRQFNLVTFDMRSRGETEGVVGDAKFNPAEDAYYFMKALGLPPCHLFGVSMGAVVASDLTVDYPDRVLSITACSVITPIESELNISGRLEVHELWSQACLASRSSDKNDDVCKQLLHDAIVGIKQFAFNNEENSLLSAIVDSSMSQAQRHWFGSIEKTREGYQATVAWALERKMRALEELKTLSCPIAMIHCSEDVAYPLENSQALVDMMKGLGIKVDLYQVQGSHYGCVGGARLINPILCHVVLSCYNRHTIPFIPITAERYGVRMRTPFQELLEKCDYHPADDISELEGL